MRCWVLPSEAENWRFSLSHTPAVWGLRRGRMNQAYFDRLMPGDSLLMYVTKDIGGFIGRATLREKYVDGQTPYWPDERRAGRVIYPLRFRMDLDLVLPQDLWSAMKLPRPAGRHRSIWSSRVRLRSLPTARPSRQWPLCRAS